MIASNNGIVGRANNSFSADAQLKNADWGW
jgi:hypothetical protein